MRWAKSKTAFAFMLAMTLSIYGSLTKGGVIFYALGWLFLFPPYYAWAYICAKEDPAMERVTSTQKIIILSVINFISGVFVMVVFPPMKEMSSKTITHLIGFSFFLSLVAKFILAARAFSRAEKNENITRKPLHPVLTFICLYYLPIGMFFLAPRIKELRKL